MHTSSSPLAWTFVPVEADKPTAEASGGPGELPGYVVMSDRGTGAAVDAVALALAAIGAALVLASIVVL